MLASCCSAARSLPGAARVCTIALQLATGPIWGLADVHEGIKCLAPACDSTLRNIDKIWELQPRSRLAAHRPSAMAHQTQHGVIYTPLQDALAMSRHPGGFSDVKSPAAAAAASPLFRAAHSRGCLCTVLPCRAAILQIAHAAQQLQALAPF